MDEQGVDMSKIKAISLFAVLLVATGSATAGPKDEGSYEVHGETSNMNNSGSNYVVTHGRNNRKSKHRSNQTRSHVNNSRKNYVGFGFGSSRLDVDDKAESYKDTNIRAYLGYDLNRYFAIEGGIGAVPLEDYLNDVGDLTGIDVSVLAKLPVTSRLSAYARLGYWDWDFSDPDKGKGHSFFGGTDMLYGIGLDYQVSPKFKMRLDAIRYEADDAKLDTINGSIAYSW